MATNTSSSLDQERVERIELLVRRLEQIEKQEDRQTAEQLMQAVLDLHGEGLGRMLDLVFESGASGEALARRFANDNLISSLLVLHGLHPDDLETRVRQSIAKLPGHLEVVSVAEGVVRLRLSSGACGSIEADDESLQAMLREAVPDVGEIVIQRGTGMNSFVPLQSLGGSASRAG